MCQTDRSLGISHSCSRALPTPLQQIRQNRSYSVYQPIVQQVVAMLWHYVCLDLAIPLVNLVDIGRNLQERSFYFSVNYGF